MIYLATPFQHPLAAVRHTRFYEACELAAKLMERGEVVFSPIAHSYHINTFLDTPGGHEFWMRQDLSVLEHCSKLLVAKMDGWEQSRGIAAEIQFAKENNIPVKYLDPVTMEISE